MNSGSESTQQRLFLFYDVVNSVGCKTRHGNVAYQKAYRQLDDAFREIVAGLPGATLLQDLGDGRLCTFATSSEAVQAALSLQYSLAHMPWEIEPLAVRVGMHFGEVNVSATGSYSGLAIDTASRVMSLAFPNQILMTRTIFDDARAFVRKHPRVNGVEVTQPLHWVSHGEYLFKGLGEPHEIFEVFVEGIGPGQPPPNSEKARRADADDLSWRPKAGEPIPYRTPTWTLKQPLGAGSFGDVWVAERGAAQNVFKFCFDPERLAALRNEVELFDRMHNMLGDRTDIQHVLDYHFENAPPYYVQYEYAGGGSLVDWFKSQGGVTQVPLATRLDIVRQVALALDAAHSAGVLHLDVKPANVLMRQDAQGSWRTVLADFGMGKVNTEVLALQKSQTLESARASGALDTSGGTMAYMAPELIDLKPATTRSDIYSLGIFLYQMVVGEIKALAPGWEHAIDDPLLKQDIADCVAGNPERRFASARALADRLRDLPQRRARARWQRVRWRATMVTLVGILCAIPVVTSLLFERERRLKVEASDLFQQSVSTIRAVFGEATSDELRDLPELVKLRQNLVEYCESFALRNQEYLANYPEYDNLFGEFADEIKVFDQQLGNTLYERAIAYQDVLQHNGRKIPPERIPELHIKRGELRTDLGQRDARNELEEAGATLRQLLDSDPRNPTYRFLLGICYHNLAYNYQALDARLKEALEQYRVSQNYLEGLVRDFCESEVQGRSSAGDTSANAACSRYRQELARSHGYQGDAYLEASDEAAARSAYDESQKIRESLVQEEPDNEERRFELARSYQNSGRLSAWLDKIPDAIENFRQASAIQRKLHDEKRSVVKFKTDLIFSCLREAELHLDQGDVAAAEPLIAQADEKSADLADSLNGLDLKAGAAVARARLAVQQKSADASQLIAEAQQRLQRFIGFSENGHRDAVIPPEQIKSPQALYDLGVVAALHGTVAGTPELQAEARRTATEHIGRAIQKGYRDRRRLERDRALQTLDPAERDGLLQAINAGPAPDEPAAK